VPENSPLGGMCGSSAVGAGPFASVGGSLFPLPEPAFEGKAGPGSSRRARQRGTRFEEIKADAAAAVSGLNSLFGCAAGFSRSPASHAQAAVLQHVVQRIAALRPHGAPPDPRAAFSELLGERSQPYGTVASPVVDFVPEKVAVPPPGSKPIDLASVMGGRGAAFMEEEQMLLETEVFEERRRAAPFKLYGDRVLARSARARRTFLKMLADANLLGVARQHAVKSNPSLCARKTGHNALYGTAVLLTWGFASLRAWT